MSVVWTCPVCARKIPARVLECYCGVRKAQVVLPALARQAEATQERSHHLAILGWCAAGVLLVALLFQRSRPDPPITTAAPEAVTQAPTRWPPPTAPQPATVNEQPLPGAGLPPVTEPAAQVSPSPSTSPTPTPSPSPSPSPSQVDTARTAGTQAFGIGVASIASRARDVEARIQRYASNCGSDSPRLYSMDGCDGERESLEAAVAQIGEALESAGDAARRAWVDPGTQRRLLAQAGMEDVLPELRRQLSAAAAVRR